MKMILICLLVVSTLVSGCGGGGVDEDDIQVVATTEVAADIVRQLAGPDAEVESLLPAGASPHDFAISAKERVELEQADVLVAWGAGLEAGLPLEDADPIELAEGERDPHVWMDPTRIAAELPRLAAALAEADPDGASRYRARADRFARRLAELDRDIRDVFREVPPPRRKLVTSHDSLGHFADRYGLEFVGAPFGLAPESEPSAARVADLVERIERERVPAVFAEDSDDPEVLEQIGREANVEVVDDLLVEGFGDRVGSYEEMLRFDARRIADALGR